MIAQSTNRLLAALPPDEYRRLMPKLHTIHLRAGEGLPHCGEARVYFLESGLCSIGHVMSDGRAIEVGAVGNEGVVGVSAITGVQPFTNNFYLQITTGSARFMLLDGLNRELPCSQTLRQLIDRFSRGLLESMVQSAACNSLHTVQHRCVRWLLTAQDRIGRAQFELSNELFARVLGIKKSKLAIVLKRLEKLHIVDTAGGLMTIADRTALEDLACGCYARISRAREDAMPPGTAARFRGRANVVQLVPDVTCGRCHSAANLPHDTEHECITAIDAEMRVLSARSIKLHALRKRLVDERLRVMRKYLEESRKLWASKA